MNISIHLENLSSKKMMVIVTTLATLISMIMIVVFFSMKNGYFCDEIYSYSTANSSESMSPVVDFDNTLHIDKWYTAAELMQTVTLSREEMHNYRHINEQLAEDAHPPLYFYLLHFFSSFFIGSFSWIPSVIINASSIFIMLIFFYRLVLLISNNRFISILTMCCFSGTSAMINLMTFSRNYTLMTSFVVIYSFYLLKSLDLYKKGKKYLLCLAFSSFFLFLAIYSQYISLVFAFIMTLLTTIYCIIKKAYKFLLQLVSFSAISIFTFIILFPEITSQLSIKQTAIDNSSAYPFLLELRTTIHILFSELLGINTPMRPTMLLFWLFWITVALVFLLFVVVFLFRNDSWYQNLSKKIMQQLQHILSKENISQSYYYFLVLFSVIFSIFIVCYTFKMYYYYPSSDRYLFFLFPFCITLIIIPLMKIIKKDYARILLIVIIMTLSLIYGNKFYLYRNSMPLQKINKTLTNSDVLIYGTNHLAIVSSLLQVQTSNKVFITTSQSFERNEPLFSGELSNSTPLFMIYEWPSFSLLDEHENFVNLLKKLKESNITTINSGDKDNYDSKIVGSFNNFIVIQLR